MKYKYLERIYRQMLVFETSPTGKERIEKDVQYVYRMFSKNLVDTDSLHFIRDLTKDIIWFTPKDCYVETFKLLMAEFYNLTEIKEDEVQLYSERYHTTFEIYNDPENRSLKKFFEKLVKK